MITEAAMAAADISALSKNRADPAGTPASNGSRLARFAQWIGLGHGKSEAWYILSATPGAKIAIGLKRQLTAPQLRASIEDGSISDLVQM
jgi:hypothetical protein